MPQISLPTINWGKRKTRSQMNEIFTDDGRIIEAEFPVSRACMDDETLGNSFLIDAGNQFYNQDIGQWVQILGERSTVPICPISPHELQDGKKDDEQLSRLITDIFHESQEDEKLRQYRLAKRREWLETIKWIVVFVVVGFLIMYGMRLKWG